MLKNNKYNQPIDHVLNALLNNETVEKFDIINAIDQWNRFKNREPVAFAKDNGDGNLYDLRKSYNPYDDISKVVPLFRN